MLISIIIPAYNCEKTISSCIQSLLMQTYTNIEIIIVDDGSVDGTYEIVRKYSYTDNRIICVRQDNGGPGAARNSGMKVARGEYFTFVDADDTVEAVYIEKMANAAIKYDLELVISNISVYGKRKKKTSEECTLIEGNRNVKNKVIPLIKNGRLNSPFAKLYKMDIQKKNDVYMPTYNDIGEDLQFNLSYMKYVSRMGLLDVSSYIYYTCNSILTKKYRRNEYDVRVENIKRIEVFFKNSNIENTQFTSYLYLKLMYAECMNMRKHLTKKERFIRIEQLLNKEDIQNAIKELRPEGMIQKVMLFGVQTKKPERIDFVAFVLNIGKVLGKNITRASV